MITKFWRPLCSLMGSQKAGQGQLPRSSAQQLLEFFNAKVDRVRQSAASFPVQSKLPIRTQQHHLTSVIYALLMKSGGCKLIPVEDIRTRPTAHWHSEARNCCHTSVTCAVCNATIQQGCLPSSQTVA